MEHLLFRSRDAEPATAPSSRQLWLVAVVLSVLFVAFEIASSMHSAALSLPVTYDDVMYFNDALGRLNVLYRSGGHDFLAMFWTNPPHSPLSTLQALLAFGLVGPHRWAADATSFIPLALLLRLYLGYATRWLPLATATAIGAAFLAFPLLGMLVLEFRPDQLCALLTATGALIITMDVSWMQGRRRTQAVVGALLVGALLAKPTLTPVTLVVFAVAAGASILMHSRSKAEAWRATKIVLVVAGICALVVLPYYIAVFKTLYSYIMVNAFGKNASIWSNNGNTPDPALYYITGPGGQAAIGMSWLVLSGLLLLAAAPIWIKRWRTALATLAVCVVAYLSVTLPGMKSAFIGAVVPALVGGIALLLSVLLLGRLRPWGGAVGAVALVAFAAWTWKPVFYNQGFPVPVQQVQHFQRIYDQTVAVLSSVPQLEHRRLYMPVIAQYLNADNIEFGLRSHGLNVPVVYQNAFEGSIDVHRSELAKSDVVVVFSDDSNLPLPWPASVNIRKEITQAVDQAGLVQIGTVDAGPYKGTVRILARPSALQPAP